MAKEDDNRHSDLPTTYGANILEFTIRSRIEDARIVGYRNWVLSLDQQVAIESISATERADTIARVIAARDAIIASLNERAEAADAHYISANTDPLTGLPNRRFFDTTYENLVSSGQPFGLLHLDLDHFGDKNTEWGHAGGDQVLVQTALRMTSQIRQVELRRPGFRYFERAQPAQAHDVATRTGGDEFLILLPGITEEEQLQRRAEEIRTAIGDHTYVLGTTGADRRSATVTTSIGGGIYRGGDPKAFMKNVDSALYVAKQQRNQSVILNRGRQG